MAEQEPEVPQAPRWSPPPPPSAPYGGYQGGADIPPDSPQHQNPQRQASRAGGAVVGGGGLLAYLLKVGFLGKFLLSGGSFLLSFGAYAIFWGPWAAAGVVLMIFVHEMGHVVEIQRQGLRATAPVFIPFMGAAIFQREHPQSALKQAEIGIAGPIAGTIGATVAFAAYGSTHFAPLLIWAWFGFLINLINLIPAGMLDGGWILAPVSKWIAPAGLGFIVLAYAAGVAGWIPFQLSPIILLPVLLGLPMTLARVRARDQDP